MSGMPIRIGGIAWYREDDYPRILEIMEDAKVLPATFKQWEQIAKQTESEGEMRGLTVVRAIIDPETFPDWCAARGLNVDAKARIRFANEFVLDQARSVH